MKDVAHGSTSLKSKMRDYLAGRKCKRWDHLQYLPYAIYHVSKRETEARLEQYLTEIIAAHWSRPVKIREE